ncbi:MAG: hypothetical protein AAB840_02055 [Patescibacteria group bacterium]
MRRTFFCAGLKHRFEDGRLEVLVIRFLQPVRKGNISGPRRIRIKFPGGMQELREVEKLRAIEDAGETPDALGAEIDAVQDSVLRRELQQEIGGEAFRVISHEHLLTICNDSDNNRSEQHIQRWDTFDYSGSLRTGVIDDGEDRLYVPEFVDAKKLHQMPELLPSARLALESLFLRLSEKFVKVRDIIVELGLEPDLNFAKTNHKFARTVR